MKKMHLFIKKTLSVCSVLRCSFAGENVIDRQSLIGCARGGGGGDGCP